MLIPNSFVTAANPSVADFALVSTPISPLKADAKLVILLDTKTTAITEPIVFIMLIMRSLLFTTYKKNSAAFFVISPIASPTLSQLTLSKALPNVSIPSRMDWDALLKSFIIMPSIFDFIRVNAPLTLSFMVSAIACAAPSDS